MKIALISTNTYPGDQGLRTVSSYLKEKGFETKMIFLPYVEDYSKLYSKKIILQILNLCKDCNLIGISSMASTSKRAIQVIKNLKRLNVPLIWGGVHATISPESCIPYVNYVCVGEGEEAIYELARAIKEKQEPKEIAKIKNLWINKGDIVIKNVLRPLEENLDKLPFADFSLNEHYLLDGENLRKFKEEDLNGMIFFQTERGCPHACTYCINKKIKDIQKGLGKIVRAHSIDYVIRNLVYLKNKFKTLKYFDLRDETFFVRSLDEIKEFSIRYKQEVGLRFKILGDPANITDEKMKLLVEAGLTDIIIGIQSGSDRINKEVYKRYITKEQVLNSARIINKYKNKLTVMYDIIACNPYENRQDVLDSIELIMKIPSPFFLSVNNLVFFTGSELYEKAKQDGIIKTEKDSASNLNYWDRFKHIKLKKKNMYLTLILNLMRGVVTKSRLGIMPRNILKILINKKMITFNEKVKIFTLMVGRIVQIMDMFREKIAKPIYRNTPLSFKIWYDKRRYQV